jgi:flavin-dependent dehydrogenase
VLDEALLDQAAVHGVRVRRGQAVRGMTVTHTGLTLRTDRADIRARTIFLATGKHDLRGAARPVHGAGPIGLKTYLRLMPEQRSELGGHVELILFPGGYAGLQPVEGDAAVLCTIVDRTRFAAVGGTWQALLNDLMAGCPHLAARLAGSIGLRDRPVAVAGIPYGHLHRSKPDDPPGVFRLGDQACVIPSLTGDGVAIALHSARLAVQTWSRGGDAIDHHRRLANSLRLQMTIAGVAHRLCLGPAQAWIAALGQASPAMLRWVAAWTRLHAPPKVPRSAH